MERFSNETSGFDWPADLSSFVVQNPQAFSLHHGLMKNEMPAMNRHDLEQKLPTMTQAQLVDTVKTCLDMIERLENDLSAGARKLEEMSALVKKLSDNQTVG